MSEGIQAAPAAQLSTAGLLGSPAPTPIPPLSNHRRIASTDITELHDEVEPFAVGHDLQPLEPQAPLDGIVNAATVGAVSLVWVRYGGGGVIVDTPPTEGEFAMCAPMAPMGVEYRRRKTHDVADISLVLSHDEAMRMTPHPEHGCLVIATSTGRLSDYLTAYLEDEPGQPLRFHSSGQPGLAPSRIVEQTWRHVCGVLDQAATGALHPLAARSLEESLLTAILLCLPHTATGQLARAPRRAPHHLADIIRDWVDANYHRPIGVSDMAAAAGIGIRQLQVICRDRWGVTPTQLLRGVRLDHARDALRQARPGPDTISRIAAEAGYLHLSRFGAHYRQRFGESPTQTLKLNWPRP
ncbi:AraC family transcriptional regulator [Spirillospora sp. NPDC048911]|uniref:AraC family transcriptional regulator n=1 Tax=Spirillospora sp. NPDC048911 TaxID=3364527 RepID=UPI003710ACCA